MSRVLIIGDGGCHTGFARATENLGNRLVTMYGHDVHNLAVNYRGDYWPTPIKLYPATMRNGSDIYGMTRVEELLTLLEPECVIILNDPQIVLRYLFDNKSDKTQMLPRHPNVLLYMPIDGYDQPPMWQVLGKLPNIRRVAMTEFGSRYMDDAPVVFHGVDRTVFRPIDASHPLELPNGRVVRSKRECKEALGFKPNGFLVLRVDRNSQRKDFPATIKSLWPFLERHADAQVHFHCLKQEPMGFNLPAILQRRIDLKERFFFPDGLDSFTGWPDEALVALYGAGDAFISNSWGEGFGLTLAESLSCGLPVIAPDHSAITEVVGPGGILTPPLMKFTVPSGEDQMLSDIEATTDALERIYAMSRGARRKLGEAGRAHIQRFDWEVSTGVLHDLITNPVPIGESEGVPVHGTANSPDRDPAGDGSGNGYPEGGAVV